MRLYLDLPDGPMEGPERVATIGSFDGVHLGHQALIRRTLEIARDLGGLSFVLTFDPLPEALLTPGKEPPKLLDAAERVELLKGLGVDEVMVLRPRPELLGLPADVFTEGVLRRRLRVSAVVGGEGFRFGKGRGGDASLLRSLGFRVEELPPTTVGGEAVSSTRIRHLLREEGKPAEAARLLSRPFSLAGTVVRGREVGRTLGFPTANVKPKPDRLVPKRGVYACRAELPPSAPETLGAAGDSGQAPAESWRAVVNIGLRPTFEGEVPVETVEAHLLDFAGDLYGRTLRLHFHEYLRPEQRFESVEALVRQIREDVQAAARLLV